MYFPDLSKYEYEQLANQCRVLTVGWLERGRDFPVGQVSQEFVEKLKTLVRRCRAHQTRGVHSCPFCSDPYRDIRMTDESGKRILLGSAEIWIPTNDETEVLAAPDLIIHYIEEHRYLPPLKFLSAVEAFSPTSLWDAQAAFERALQPS